MRFLFVIGVLSLVGLTMISGGSMLIDVGAFALLVSTALAIGGFMVINASKRSTIKFDPRDYYQASRRSK